MKIKQSDYEILKKAAQAVKTNNPQVSPETYLRNIKKGNVDMRFRWDLFSAAKNYIPNPHDFQQELYKYLNDDHIDTALRKIVREIY